MHQDKVLSNRGIRTTAAVAAVMLACFGGSALLAAQERVSFPTTDGKTIHGTLHLPDGAVGELPAVILLHSGQHDQNILSDLSQQLAREGMAALRIDRRGRGLSVDNGELHELPQKDLDNQGADVQGAIEFLSGHARIDDRRIALLGELDGADIAVLGGRGDPRIKSLVFISPRLGEEARRYLLTKPELPLLFLTASVDRTSFRDIGSVYGALDNESSDLIVYDKGGFGATMLTYAERLSKDIVQWLVSELKSLPRERDVTFTTEDGWNLKGIYYDPGNRPKGAKVPAVVLVHGANHDSYAYHELAPMLAKKGLAVLRFDWRGRGRSRGQAPGNSAEVHRDIKAAIEFTVSQEGVDANRIGIVSATRGSLEALIAADGDPRVKSQVVLSAYLLNDDAFNLVSRSKAPFLFVASKDDVNFAVGSLGGATAKGYRLAGNRGSRLIMYESGGRGTGMFDENPTLQTEVVDWLVEHLGPETSPPSK